jgi:PAS domain S-box-containing protein
MKTFRRAVEDRKPFRVKCRLELPDGRTRYVTEEGSVTSADGEYPRYIEGYVVDDVDSVDADTKPDKPDQTARDVLDKSRDAFLAVDSMGQIVAWSRQSEETFGWSRSAAIGRDLADLLVPRDQIDQFREEFRKLVESPSHEIVSESKNVSAARRTGQPFPVELTIWPSQAQDGVILNAFVHGLSERRAMEDQLAQAETSLKRMSREDSLTGYCQLKQNSSVWSTEPSEAETKNQ